MVRTTGEHAANGHIEVDSYTVTVGRTRIRIRREGAMWAVGYYGDASLGAMFPDSDHEAMMSTAVEFAKRLDAARRAVSEARQAEDAVHEWLRAQVYVPAADPDLVTARRAETLNDQADRAHQHADTYGTQEGL